MPATTARTQPQSSTRFRASVTGGSLEGIWLAIVMVILAGTGAAGQTLKEFRLTYPLKPVRSYTFLGTENSIHQLWGRTARYDKPIVESNGVITGWFNPVAHVAWVGEAMRTGAYDFGLVDGYLPVVRYVYRKAVSDKTCEMTAFAVDSTVPGEVFVHVSLVEKTDGKEANARYFRLQDKVPVDRIAFETALQGVRDRWTWFFAQGVQIPCDDPDVMNACKASIIRALITFTNKRSHYGVRSYGPGKKYGIEYGDGFPPTIIALVDCLLDWGQAPLARDYLTAYFDVFVQDNGRVKYYVNPNIDGCSVSEYGQFLWLVRKCMDAAEVVSGLSISVRSWNVFARSASGARKPRRPAGWLPGGLKRICAIRWASISTTTAGSGGGCVTSRRCSGMRVMTHAVSPSARPSKRPLTR